MAVIVFYFIKHFVAINGREEDLLTGIFLIRLFHADEQFDRNNEVVVPCNHISWCDHIGNI